MTTSDKKGKPIKEEGRLIKVAAPEGAPPTGENRKDLNLGWKRAADAKAVRARFVVRMSATGRIGTADVALGTP